MDKERVFEGEWFLPGKIEEKVFGTLKYAPGERIILSIFEGFEKEIFLEDLHLIKIIHGNTIDGKRITLYNCIEIHNQNNLVQKTYSKWSVDYVFIGHQFDNESDIKPNKIMAYFPILNEWMFKNGFKLSKTSLYDFDLKYKSPLDIKHTINEDFKIEFNFNIVHTVGARNSFRSHQKNIISITTSKDKSFFELERQIYVFRDLITLFSFRPVYLNSLKIIITDNKYPVEVLIGFNKVKEDKRVLFVTSYQNIEDDFGDILRKWYKLDKEAPEILGLFLEVFYNEGRILENKFLNLLQAMESFHRKFRKNTVYGKEEFKNMLDEIVDSVPLEHKNFVKEKLNFGNEPSLHFRLEELISEVPSDLLNVLINDKAIFIKQIKQTRNYFTHYDNKLKNKALKGQKLFNTIQKGKTLFLIIILQEIGLNKHQIQDSISVIKTFISDH
ncbi:HEPN domain-containing protein [Myroides odoratus]|uniref:ApeA N-terminal domain 1-containing protein n=1 Tax=Myroides odoratus TaxID=256 RepID=UPI000765E438|nr:HEPN domain-containing protein [Myroides odoratus]